MRRRERVEFVEALAATIPLLVERAGVAPDTCVTQTKIAVDVAREAGLRARAFPVKIVAAPPPGTSYRGGPYIRRIGFDRGDALDGPGTVVVQQRLDDEHWNGHLGALVEERFYVDPSIGQLAMRVPPIPFRPFAVEVGRPFVRGRPISVEDASGSVLDVIPDPGNRGFLDGEWRAYPVLIRAVLAEVRRRL